MKKLILTVSLSLMSVVFLMAQADYTMFETMYLSAKNGKAKELTDALDAHNKKYHNAAPHEASVHYISVGQHAGEFSWLMGPCTFSDLDTRPSGEHDVDWEKTVTPFVHKTSDVEYWVMKDRLSYTPEGDEGSSKLFVRSWDIKDGMNKKFDHVLAGILAVFKENKYTRSFRVYSSAFDTGTGRDMIGVMGFDKWAFFDEDTDFQKDYESLHGEGSWAFFEDEFETCVNSTTIEIREVVESK